jgi:hypothetical protein
MYIQIHTDISAHICMYLPILASTGVNSQHILCLQAFYLYVTKACKALGVQPGDKIVQDLKLKAMSSLKQLRKRRSKDNPQLGRKKGGRPSKEEAKCFTWHELCQAARPSLDEAAGGEGQRDDSSPDS